MSIQFASFNAVRSTRRGVLAYIRVSSEEQAERRNSLEEQKRRIQEHFEGRLGLRILAWYVDAGASAFKEDERREQFWKMIERAKSDPEVGIIAVDEESRFYRNKYRSAAIKGELLQYGVTVQTVRRDADPRTIAGLWLETIEETMAHAHSLQNREYTLRGMKGNVHGRDPKTGWAFKNGGEAPYGWRAVRINLGRDARGREINRTIWELDPEKAEIRRKILLWRKGGLPYHTIRDKLNELGIPAPRGGPWSTSTIIGMLREDMVWTAAGYTVWNKHQRKQKQAGEKWKPVSEWVVVPNAHPAIISEEEAKAILAVNQQRHKEHTRGLRKDRVSPYLLVGDNKDGVPLFICGACGARVIGKNPGGRNRRKYVCSTKEYRGAQYCPSERIDAEKLDNAVIELIKQKFTKETIIAIINAANEAIRALQQAPKSGDPRRARLREIEKQLDRIQASILAGVDPSLWVAKINELQEEKKQIEAVLEHESENTEAPRYRLIEPEEAERIAEDLVNALHTQDLPQRRKVIVSLIRQITLAPKQGVVYVEFHDDPLDLNAPTLYALPVYGDIVAPPTGRDYIAIHI